MNPALNTHSRLSAGWIKFSFILFFSGCSGLLLLGGCSKSHNGFDTHLLMGKWTQVADTIYHYPITIPNTVLTGSGADSWDFRSDGKVYRKEGSYSDTSRYIFYSDTRIGIEHFGFGYEKAGASLIVSLTEKEAVIVSDWHGSSLQDMSTQVVHLKK